MSIEAWLASQRGDIEAALHRIFPDDAGADVVYQAMRYSMLAGGKRMRPMLALLTADAVGLPREQAVPYACVLEMVHTYSLIHDDLPAMDDDDLRRGRPTCHKVYGEAVAILAGDALLTKAYEVLADAYADLPAPRLARSIKALSVALGTSGMVGGQSGDLAAEGRSISLETLQHIHAGKTGALFRVCLTGIGCLAGAGEDVLASLGAYGEQLGLVFQIRDDLLDIEGTAQVLGKTPGKDAAQRKATYPRIVGLETARRLLASASEEAARLAERLPGANPRFAELAAWAAGRSS